MSDRRILAFDTSAAHCAAALLCGDRVIVARAEEMGRGQAERLIPLLEDVLAEGGIGWGDLDAIGVGVGPGNFTGIRISVSAARGLALGLDVPAIGVSGFEAIAFGTTDLPAIPGPRGQLYVQRGTPDLIPADEVDEPVALPPAPADFAVAIARVALSRLDGPHEAPAPMYVKPADAAPSKDAPPVILDDA
ncbi:tRNA (adenosine(37)-N6)-threonylcarbamoyltransferase complex dimerization subunit type 1 TsaB [Thalassobius vesicularis]|uniref:tRNA (Adenosine(37)-N6)-threonylcarbamoyltransferase complex dimerization subunit type 1 TsaB n=1 Tax=Thalassobius vesicularis TaxID=1294297 RepID=A0A4S3MDH2_9RHOB|nr:tRNA (adenosine(37)-N6)-threonylcarbamoyltransferase complex dimerization subunit type 1 TsaB [Thalassobius vesicularis]THD76306.1 tRNA (adenosine(37)-N6)-threonylcarbamoyltransferase complex dimerization subunit type 1 TsaB [Thalassobius vesicularis]